MTALKKLIEGFVEEVLFEDRKELATNYAKSLQKRNPELYSELESIAKFAINAVKNNYTPSEKIVSMNRIMNTDPEMDPRISGDTHGIRLFIDYMIDTQDEKKDSRLAGKAKKWYQSTMDYLLRKHYSTPSFKKESYVFGNKALLKESNESLPIRKNFKMDLPRDLLELADIFTLNGFELYVVGGAVRDAILGKEPKDFDVATNAKPEEVLAMLAKHPEYKTLEIGRAFGIINAISPKGNEYEIATFRNDLSGGRRPDAVEFTSIDNDVKRRDLTYNALFYDIANQQIVDYVGGLKDLELNIVRAVGNAKERFNEDKLRILRAIRFAARFGAMMDPETEKAIVEDNSLFGVSKERIRDEFLKSIISAKSVVNLFEMYSHFDLWSQVFPDLKINTKFQDIKNIPVILAVLLKDNNPKTLMKDLNTLKYTANEIKQISFLTLFQGLSPENAFQLKKLFESTKLSPEDLLLFSSAVGMPDKNLVNAFNKYTPSVDSQKLMDTGLSGKQLGQAIQNLEKEAFEQLL